MFYAFIVEAPQINEVPFVVRPESRSMIIRIIARELNRMLYGYILQSGVRDLHLPRFYAIFISQGYSLYFFLVFLFVALCRDVEYCFASTAVPKSLQHIKDLKSILGTIVVHCISPRMVNWLWEALRVSCCTMEASQMQLERNAIPLAMCAHWCSRTMEQCWLFFIMGNCWVCHLHLKNSR